MEAEVLGIRRCIKFARDSRKQRLRAPQALYRHPRGWDRERPGSTVLGPHLFRLLFCVHSRTRLFAQETIFSLHHGHCANTAGQTALAKSLGICAPKNLVHRVAVEHNFVTPHFPADPFADLDGFGTKYRPHGATIRY